MAHHFQSYSGDHEGKLETIERDRQKEGSSKCGPGLDMALEESEKQDPKEQ